MKKIILLCAFASVAIIAVPVSAANVISIKEQASVKGTPATIWAQIGGFCAIADWHPAVEKCEESAQDGATFRTLTLEGGGTIKEKKTGNTDSNYTYQIVESPLPVANYNSVFSARPDYSVEGNTVLSWSATFDAHGKPDSEAKATMEGIFRAGIDGLKKKLAAQ